MRGVVVAAEFRARRAAGVHTPVRHANDRSAVRRDLLGALGGDIVGHIHPARDSRRRRIGRNRRARVARRVNGDVIDAEMREFADEALRPAILERTGRLTILHFEKELMPVHLERQERRLRLAESHRLMAVLRVHRSLIQAKKPAAFTRIGVRCDGVFLFASLAVEMHDRSSFEAYEVGR